MNRIKTLSLPLISAALASVAMPLQAQVRLELSSNKTYRQNPKSMKFSRGNFNVELTDGSGVYVGGCARSSYWPPNVRGDICPLGSTGFLTYGSLDGKVSVNFPYLSITSVTPSIIVEPRRPDLAFLRAAPASLLPRPQAGFKDSSFAVYYNLHTTDLREYIITRYENTRGYSSTQRTKFEKEIVPGVYYYSFPRLNNPQLIAPISSVIYPMPEGLAEINSQKVGVEFTGVNSKKPVWNKGFMELSYLKPNVVQWNGFDPSVVYASADKLYLSIRVLSDSLDPTSPTDTIDNSKNWPQSIFPGFASGGDPRVLLKNPYVKSFTTPPIFSGGTRGVLELELQRALMTSGVTYDSSNRKFQIPVIVVNRYAEYADVIFGDAKSKTGLLDDFDGDGFNNLNEWILDSSANGAASEPIAPVPLANASYFGFSVEKKLSTIPAVKYILQRSRDRGKTWERFVTDDNWLVRTVRVPAGAGSERDPARVQIRVESKIREETVVGGSIIYGDQIQPPGTQRDIYRVKIVLRK